MHLRWQALVTTLILPLVLFVIILPVRASVFNAGCTEGVGDSATLIGAFVIANSNGQHDVINLTAGCTYTVPTTLTVESDGGHMVTLNGNGATIVGNASLVGIVTLNNQAEAVINQLTITQGGSGILNRGTLTLNDSVVTGNVGSNTLGVGIFNLATLVVRRSTISNNSGASFGAGILNQGGLELADSIVSGNAALGQGGGIYNQGGLLIHNSTFNENMANQGAGLYHEGAGNSSIINSTFLGNEAAQGGAIYFATAISVFNSTFSGNNTTLVGNSFINPVMPLNNSIVANGTGADCTGFVTAANSLIEGGGCGVVNGVNGNKIGIDPALDAATGNPAYLPLTSDSPAINAGSNALIPGSVTTDQASRPRILNGTVDMGAYEYAAPTSLTLILNLQGRDNPPGTAWVNTIHVEVRPTGQTTPYQAADYVSDTSGKFFLPDLYPGSYDLWIKGTHTLGQIVPLLLVSGTDISGIGSPLLEGDANDDNATTIGDFSILASTFSKASGDSGYDARADFNGSGTVTIADFSLLAANYAQGGTP